MTGASLVALIACWYSAYPAAIRQAVLRSRRFGASQAVPLHRDFHLRQLFDDGKFVTVVDWDLSAQGDPAFDVAYLTTCATHYNPVEAEAGASVFWQATMLTKR